MTQQPDGSRIRSHIMVVLATLIWGFNNIAMKIAYREIDPWMFNGIRLAAVLPFVLIAARWMPGYRPFVLRDLLQIAGIALIGFTGFQLLFPLGVHGVSAPVSGIMVATMPVWLVLINRIAKTDTVTPLAFTGVLVTVAGIISISVLSGGDGAAGGGTTLKGILFITLAELFFAVNTVFLRPYMRRYSVAQVTSVAVVMAVVLFGALLNRRFLTFDYAGLSLITWVMILFSGIIGLFLANLLWNSSIRRIGSTRVAVYGNLPPVFVLLFGALVLDEVLFGLQIAAAVIIGSGVVLVQVHDAGMIDQFVKRAMRRIDR